MYDFKALEHAEATDFALKIPVELLEDLKFVSNFCGRDVGYLINCYIANGLMRIMTKVRSEKFLAHAKEILEQNQVPQEAIETIVEKFGY